MNTKNTPRKAMTGLAMRGGIDLDDMEKYPEATYWAHGARSALKNIREICGCTPLVLDDIWSDDRTWMEICLKTERVLSLIKALVKKD